MTVLTEVFRRNLGLGPGDDEERQGVRAPSDHPSVQRGDGDREPIDLDVCHLPRLLER